jgi:hypothetical protein
MREVQPRPRQPQPIPFTQQSDTVTRRSTSAATDQALAGLVIVTTQPVISDQSDRFTVTTHDDHRSSLSDSHSTSCDHVTTQGHPKSSADRRLTPPVVKKELPEEKSTARKVEEKCDDRA